METKKTTKKVLQGTVTSNKMHKTVVVSVTRFEKHPKYKKYIKVSKKYKAHNEAGTVAVGDVVSIEECRPLSKDKHFTLVK